MAFSTLLSFFIVWTQRYIVKSVQEDQNLEIYFYSQLALSIIVLFLSLIVIIRVFGCEPGSWSKPTSISYKHFLSKNFNLLLTYFIFGQTKAIFARLDKRREESIGTTEEIVKSRKSVAVPVDYRKITTAYGFSRENVQIREMIQASLIGVSLRDSVFTRRRTTTRLSNLT